MTDPTPRAQPRPRAFETAVREQLRACAEHRFASPHVTPVARPADRAGEEQAG